MDSHIFPLLQRRHGITPSLRCFGAFKNMRGVHFRCKLIGACTYSNTRSGAVISALSKPRSTPAGWAMRRDLKKIQEEAGFAAPAQAALNRQTPSRTIAAILSHLELFGSSIHPPNICSNFFSNTNARSGRSYFNASITALSRSFFNAGFNSGLAYLHANLM